MLLLLLLLFLLRGGSGLLGDGDSPHLTSWGHVLLGAASRYAASVVGAVAGGFEGRGLGVSGCSLATLPGARSGSENCKC